MKLDNLEVGMVVKNYKELCELLELDVKGGTSKINQMIWIEDYIKYKKDGHKFIIIDIYDDIEIVPLLDKRGGCTYIADYPQFKVHPDKWNSIGIYKITRGNEIYVGSTIASFRKRFLGHTTKANVLRNIYELIHNGGVFEILQECDDMVEDEIRALERKYIKYYSSMPGKYKVLNEQGFNKYKTKRTYKYKIVKRFDTNTNNMITQYKQGHKLLHEERHKINEDPDIVKMLGIIENNKSEKLKKEECTKYENR